MNMSCFVTYSVGNRMTFKGGHKEIALKMLIDFKNKKVMGEIELKFKGQEKRIICDSFLDAQDIYSLAEDWVDGELDAFFDETESEDAVKEEGNADDS